MFKDAKTLAVYVTNKEKAQKFYTEILGFELAHDLGPDLCFLRSTGGKVYIYLEAGKKPAAVSADHCRLSFFLEADAKAGDVYAQLKARGVRLLQEAPEPVSDDTACFQFLDPDGNILEVSAGI
jgi:catechol 2,3-dioxygenase-like lactoylglutathione lyase family enzyme